MYFILVICDQELFVLLTMAEERKKRTRSLFFLSSANAKKRSQVTFLTLN